MQGRTGDIVLGAVLGLIFLVLLVVVHPYMVRLPEGASTFAKDVDTVYYVVYYITGAVFILVTVVLMWFLIRYRFQPGRRAVYSHGSTALELVWTIIPAVVFIIIFLISQSTWARIKILAPPGDVGCGSPPSNLAGSSSILVRMASSTRRMTRCLKGSCMSPWTRSCVSICGAKTSFIASLSRSCA